MVQFSVVLMYGSPLKLESEVRLHGLCDARLSFSRVSLSLPWGKQEMTVVRHLCLILLKLFLWGVMIMEMEMEMFKHDKMIAPSQVMERGENDGQTS